MGAQMVREVASKVTARRRTRRRRHHDRRRSGAGDHRECAKNVVDGANRWDIKRGIERPVES